MYWLKEALYWPTFWGRDRHISIDLSIQGLLKFESSELPPNPPQTATFLLRRTSCRTNGWKKWPMKMHRKSDFFRFQEKGLEVSLGRNIVLLRLSYMMTSQVLFWRYSVSWHQNQTVVSFFQLEAYLCLNSRYGSLDFSTPGVLVWKRWMLITTFAQKNPHKITDTCGSGLQWFHQTDPDGLKIPERNKKWCLATRVRICSNFPFFVCKRRCVCVCVCVLLLLFSPQKNPMNVMKIFFRGVLWSSIVSLFICCMVLCFHRKGCHEYTILQPQIWSHVRCLQRRGTIRSAITENEIAILSIW